LFLDLFYTLRARGVPTSPTEWLAFLKAMDAGLATGSPRDFYGLARALLVKRESQLDRFDLAFYEYVRGARAGDEQKLALLRALVRGGLRGVFTEEELSRLDEMTLDELLRLLDERLGRGEDEEGEGPGRAKRKERRGAREDDQGMRAAMALAERRRFRNLRSDLVLDVRQMTLAIRRLRRFAREGAPTELDLDATIEKTARNGGEIDLVERPERQNTIHLSLLVDVGGSMEPFRWLVQRLFTAAHRAGRFRRFRTYAFHNCIYGRLYRDIARRDFVATDDFLGDVARDERLIIVGDAQMAPPELFAPEGSIEHWSPGEPPAIETLVKIRRALPRSVWLNPLPPLAWDHPTVAAIRTVVPMFELTLEGLDRAIDALKMGLAWRRT
jgi:uncharacterized protein with von Willebrand factor type A (vWA) domain